MDGILNINKPAGLTSHDVVAKVRKLLGIKKVGHAGTLDPQATGVLIILVGKATKLSEAFLAEDKEYVAEMKLGLKTITQDIWGEVVEKKDKVEVEATKLTQVLLSFCGQISQIPPMVSALHYNGQRLYKLAREGRVVERVPRKVTISELELLEFQEPQPEVLPQMEVLPLPEVRFRVVCSSGTYIRTLCEDIGEALGVGGCLTSLVRTRVGRFCLEQAQSLEDIQEKGAKLLPLLI